MICVPADALQVLGPRLAGLTERGNCMKWEKPAASDMHFGFEITMYIANR
jgi:coenzyme PQQ precursor peptide PqqA